MSWHVVDDSLLERLAHLGVSVEHAYLHLEALAYCSRLGTDGVLPMDLGLVSRIPEPVHGAVALWNVGLWEPDPGAGWQIVGYLNEQRSAQRIQEDKQRARERAERSRRHKAGDHSMCRASYCKDAASRDSSTSDLTREVQRTNGAGARGTYLISSDLTDEISSNGASQYDRAPAEARAAVNEEGLRRVRAVLHETSKKSTGTKPVRVTVSRPEPEVEEPVRVTVTRPEPEVEPEGRATK